MENRKMNQSGGLEYKSVADATLSGGGWPTPPGKGPFSVGDPSRQKPLMRGEKSIYDKTGGEWRFDATGHQPDYNPHWDYKASGNNTPWQNIPQPNPPIIELKIFKD